MRALSAPGHNLWAVTWDPLAPATDMPPRVLYEWTSVEGHEVSGLERGRARCSCGEAQPAHALLRRTQIPGRRSELTAAQRGEIRRAARDWRDEHLTNAWPLLVGPIKGESLEDYEYRVRMVLEAAQAERERLHSEAEATSQEIPVATEDQMDAGVRAVVLKRQHIDVCRCLARQHRLAGTDDELLWLARAAGDPTWEL